MCMDVISKAQFLVDETNKKNENKYEERITQLKEEEQKQAEEWIKQRDERVKQRKEQLEK